jgi:hypothetical protein
MAYIISIKKLTQDRMSSDVALSPHRGRSSKPLENLHLGGV